VFIVSLSFIIGFHFIVLAYLGKIFA